jgi:hypothetical protein
MLDIKQFSSDLIDSYLDILTLDEMLLVFKEIKIIFTRYDFDLLFPVGIAGKNLPKKTKKSLLYTTTSLHGGIAIVRKRKGLS